MEIRGVVAILKYEFNNLSVLKQIEYINKLLKEGNTITNACKKIGIARSTISGRFKRAGYVYSDRLQQYYKSTTATKKVSYNGPETEIRDNYKYSTSVINEILPCLMELVDWYKDNKKVIVNATERKINVEHEQLKGIADVHSVKCYNNVYKDFNNLCKEYEQYRKQDLFSLALLEFISKYKK